MSGLVVSREIRLAGERRIANSVACPWEKKHNLGQIKDPAPSDFNVLFVLKERPSRARRLG